MWRSSEPIRCNISPFNARQGAWKHAYYCDIGPSKQRLPLLFDKIIDGRGVMLFYTGERLSLKTEFYRTET